MKQLLLLFVLSPSCLLVSGLTSPQCGDGFLDLGEECDDGANNDDASADKCRTTCQAANCGDSVADNGEACDDGNDTNGDSCDNNCTASSCSNGIAAPGELCPFTALTFNAVNSGISPCSLTVEDLDNDSDLDLAYVDFNLFGSNFNPIRLFLNDGAGDFSQQQNLGASVQRIAAHAADLNEDGFADLLSGNIANNVENNEITFSINDAQEVITFTAAAPLPSVAITGCITTEDLDNDGDLDLSFVKQDQDQVALFRNDGGVFTAAGSVDTSDEPRALVFADFNGDGLVDLATSNDNDDTDNTPTTDTVSIRLQSSAFTFTNNGNLTVGLAPVSMKAGDVDNDGDIDLVVASLNGDSLQILQNENGSFSDGGTIVLSEGSPAALALGDINQDSDLDIVLTHSRQAAGGSDLEILLGNGDMTFISQPQLPIGDAPLSLELRDFNGDGVLDIIVAAAASRQLNVFISTP